MTKCGKVNATLVNNSYLTCGYVPHNRDTADSIPTSQATIIKHIYKYISAIFSAIRSECSLWSLLNHQLLLSGAFDAG